MSLEDTRCIGIDPGYDRLGWAVGTLAQPKLLGCDCIETDRSTDIFSRYHQLTHELEQILSEYKPNVAAIEELYFSKNTSTALRVSEARGVIIQSLLSQGISIVEYGPTTIKKVVTGSGRADKTAVAKMVQLQLGSTTAVLDDALDAAACFLTHAILHDKQELM